MAMYADSRNRGLGRRRPSTDVNFQRSIYHRRLRCEPLESRCLLSTGPLHVDADSTAPVPDGLGWDTAYPALQDALDRAAALNTDADPQNDVSEIWIAEGTYKPTAQLDATDARSATFSMLDGVSLYGSFAGDEPDRDSRHGGDTILSGDLDASGGLSMGDAYHVVYADEVSDVTLDALTITGGRTSNSSSNFILECGGGMCVLSGALTVTNSTLSANWATSYGGGIFNRSGALTITNSTISNNWADYYGGGISSHFGALTVANSTISGNSARNGGGIESLATLTVTNSTISGNSAEWDGGGIYGDCDALTLINSTISGNSAERHGGGIFNSGTLTVANSIVFLNPDSVGSEIWGPLTAESGSNLIGVDPKFVDNPGRGPDDTWGTDDDLAGILRLTAQSPALNVGNNALVPPGPDLDGQLRVYGQRVDAGAYEYQSDPALGRETPTAVVTTTDDTVDLYDGAVSLREALHYVSVAEAGGPITFDALLDGAVVLLDGFSLVATQAVQIDASALASLAIDAGNRSQVVTVLVGQIELIGLTITGGSAYRGGGIGSFGSLTVVSSTVSDNVARTDGGGIYSGGTLSVIDSTISCNSAGGHNYSGGGIYMSGGTSTVANSTISDNSAFGHGGGVYVDGNGTLTVGNSTISHNAAGHNGGGIYNAGHTLTIASSTVSANSANMGTIASDLGGGGIYNFSGTLTVTNSTISGNSAFDGGGIYVYAGTAAVTCSTISGNTAFGQGGGMVCELPMTVNNSIVARNVAGGDQPDVRGPFVVGSDYNLVGVRSGDYPVGEHDLNGTRDEPLDPRLSHWTDIGGGVMGYLLLPDSPALDAGSNALAVDPQGTPLQHDLYGNPRIQAGVVDMGAVEGATQPGPAVTYVVQSLEDTVAEDGVLTFREALLAANLNQPAGDAVAGSFREKDRIEFSGHVSGNVLLDGRALTIYGDLTIQGPGADAMTVDARGASGVFQIAPCTQVDISAMTITGGNSPRGGGVLNEGTLTGTDLVISANSGDDGGGIYSVGILTLTNSMVVDNSGVSYGGTSYGGGICSICSFDKTLSVTGSTISGNSAGVGGGIYAGGMLTVSNSIISENSAGYGGGIANTRGTGVVTGSTISDNMASRSGGGLYGDLTVINSTISGNTAESGAGVLGKSTLINSTISGNSASRNGGGVLGEVTVICSTISGNSAALLGGGAYHAGHEGGLAAFNSIVAGNAAGGDPDISGGFDSSSYHNLIGVWTGAFDPPDNNNLTGTPDAPLDPGLSDWTDLGNGVWGYLLLPDSPALDAGSNEGAVDADGVPLETDIYGNPRVQDDVVDIGAVEGASQPSEAVTYVVESLAGSVAEDGVLTFSEAFLAANSNHTVGDAAPGSFGQQDRIEFSDGVSGTVVLQGQALRILGDMVIQGPGSESLTFDAQGASRVFDIIAGTNVELRQLEITGGSAPLDPYYTSVAGGGGIRNSGRLTIADSMISGNSAPYSGGGIENWGTLMISRSSIVHNVHTVGGDGGGGGIRNSGTLRVDDSTIADNSANGCGGGIYSGDDDLDAALTVTGSRISGNSASGSYGYGGGIYCRRMSPTILGSTIAGNSAGYRGGGLYTVDGVSNVHNSIIAHNTSDSFSPDISGDFTDSSSHNLIGIGSSTSNITHGVNGNLVGTAESPIDPRFVRLPSDGGDGWGDDPSTPGIDEGANDDWGDLRLMADSPAIDAGDDAWAVDSDGNPLLIDLAGSPRISGQRVDMGAYEFQFGVVGRHVFYNNSTWDDPIEGRGDDDAVAPDKVALLPCETASFANYTSFSRGINGIMVDIAGLEGTPTVDEFEFRVGNDDDPNGWAAPAVAPEVTLRPGEGIYASDRITLVWPDNAIQKQWLQVTLRATVNTGLAENDVFYFGNAIGECGNSATDAKVNATDMLAARNNQRTFLDPAPVDFPYDYDRDARVNATDMLIARNHQTSFLDALNLITVPARGRGALPGTAASALEAVLDQGVRPTAGKEAIPVKMYWLYEYDEASPADDEDDADRETVPELHYLRA